MFRSMSNGPTHDDPRLHLLDPPPPPPLMLLEVFERDKVGARAFDDVTASSLVGPSTFRFETLDGKIRLFDVAGRDFVLSPQVS